MVPMDFSRQNMETALSGGIMVSLSFVWSAPPFGLGIIDFVLLLLYRDLTICFLPILQCFMFQHKRKGDNLLVESI